MADQVPLPDFVRKCALDQLFAAEVPQHLYADPITRAFPCHSRAATWLSYADYQLRGKSAMVRAPEIGQRLDHFVQYWNLGADVEPVVKAASDQGATLPDSDFAWVRSEGGQKFRTLRMKDAAETKQAADWLQRSRDELSFEDRKTIAERILEKAAKDGVALPVGSIQAMERFACRGEPDLTKVAHTIELRRLLAKNAGQFPLAQGLAKLEHSWRTQPAILGEAGRLTKVASLLANADVVLGLDSSRWTDTIRPPEEALFAYTPTASAVKSAQWARTKSGSAYRKRDLGRLSLGQVSAALGTKVAASVQAGFKVDGEKLATHLEGLPAQEAAAFDGLQLVAREDILPEHVSSLMG